MSKLTLRRYVVSATTQGMELARWLKKTKTSKNEFARDSGVSRSTIHRVTKGHVPRASVAEKIERATGGEVTAGETLQLKRRRAA